jgi:hypothetical protein
MRERWLYIGLLAVVTLLAGPADGNAVGIRVDVFGNVSGLLASGIQESDGAVDVSVGPGDIQITFLVRMDSEQQVTSYLSGVFTPDPGEISFSSSTELSGLGFNPGDEGDPGSSGTPGLGLAISENGLVTTTDLYSVTYTLEVLTAGGDYDWGVDFLPIYGPSGDITDPAASAAYVRLNPAVPEPTSLAPLGSGLAAMGLRRRTSKGR